MAHVWGRRAADRVGAAPSSISMAVLCVVLPAMAVAVAWAARLVGAPEGVLLLILFTLVVGPPVLLAVSALLTAVYVLPTVALGHRLGRLSGHGRRWWWVVAGTALPPLPVIGLPVAALMLRNGTHEWRQLAMAGSLTAGALWAASVPACLAVHMAVLREDEGRPVRPVGDILIWGTLGLSVELMALPAFH